jgi:hypothetical protein
VTGFCKNWGMTAHVNVILHPMGWGGHHISCAQNGRGFLKQTLHVVRDRIRDFLCRRNGNRRLNNERNAGQRWFSSGWGRHHTSKQYLAGLWTNSDSELSQEINAQNRICHCSLQKFCFKKLALKLGGFVNKTPREDWLAIGTLKPRARWIRCIRCAGNNTQCCPSVHQVPVVRKFTH